jgi:hypothetical protein
VAHPHTPPLQIEPPVHIVQLSPQCAESVAELHALSAHFVLPAGHIEAQSPLLQTSVSRQTVQPLPQ